VTFEDAEKKLYLVLPYEDIFDLIIGAKDDSLTFVMKLAGIWCKSVPSLVLDRCIDEYIEMMRPLLFAEGGNESHVEGCRRRLERWREDYLPFVPDGGKIYEA